MSGKNLDDQAEMEAPVIKKRDVSEKKQPVQFPYVIKAKLQNKIISAFVFPIGLMVLGISVYLFFDLIIAKKYFELLVLICFVPIGLFFSVWPVLAVTTVTCDTDGIDFSACNLTYSRVRWEDIKEVEIQTVDYAPLVAAAYGVAYGILLNPRTGTATMSFKTINIVHDNSFLDFASALSVKNYRGEDLTVFGTLVKEKTGLSLDRKGEYLKPK